VAGRISLNAAIDPAQGGLVTRLRDGLGAVSAGPPGNKTILQGLFDAFTAVRTVTSNGFSGAFSSTELVAQMASMTGQKRIQHDAVLSSTQTQHSILLEAEQNATGVDIDAQMQDLMLVEQAYAANARVIEVASQMIKLLMEL
jgi:flagellar hook-associated protein 1 FlgK